jgi:hypothetical protein
MEADWSDRTSWLKSLEGRGGIQPGTRITNLCNLVTDRDIRPRCWFISYRRRIIATDPALDCVRLDAALFFGLIINCCETDERVADRSLGTLKGSASIAQGNALGMTAPPDQALKGRPRNADRAPNLGRPFRARPGGGRLPRALPWAMLDDPFRVRSTRSGPIYAIRSDLRDPIADRQDPYRIPPSPKLLMSRILDRAWCRAARGPKDRPLRGGGPVTCAGFGWREAAADRRSAVRVRGRNRGGC